MKSKYTVTLQEARNIQLKTLGLLRPRTKTAAKEDVMQAIKDMSILQIDTISVINKSPYVVLWSRIGDFPLEWLNELLLERKIFEYWSHAACFIPIEDYPLYKAFIDAKERMNFVSFEKWISENKEITEKIVSHITKHGAAATSTFNETKREKGGWWNWRHEKVALESLFYTGILTTSERRNFQRVYDLTKRVIPKEFRRKIRLEKVYEELIERSVHHLGITKKEWVPDYFRLKKGAAYPVFEKLLKSKHFIEVSVSGFDNPFFVHRKNEHLIQLALNNQLVPNHTTFLSPFDPLVWDRFRLKEMFNFNYQIESYTIPAKRIYGYFTLPILYKGQLIGRMDAKAHRKEKIFEVKAMHFEKDFIPDEECAEDLIKRLKDFANWHGTPTIKVTKVVPIKCMKILTQFLSL
jgi:uncharacterized protein YcaQ